MFSVFLMCVRNHHDGKSAAQPFIMESPRVSIIIPAYNAAATLRRCVESVLAQTHANKEIIVVDDGSTDASGQIADELAARHGCVSVVHQENRGLAEARRSGIAAATGDYVTHVDSDDTLPPRSVEMLLRRLTENHLDLAYGIFERITPRGHTIFRHNVTGILSGEDFLRHIFDLDCHCASWGCISRRELWQRDVWPPSGTRFPSEDVLINMRLASHARSVGIYNDVVYNYYWYPSSLSLGGSLLTMDRWKGFFEEVRRLLAQTDLADELEDGVRRMEVMNMTFATPLIDVRHSWYQQVRGYSMRGQPIKVRLLHCLLRWPRLLRWLVAHKPIV